MTAPILVFGATGGVGRALVHRLAQDGHALHLAARKADPLAALAEEVGAGYTVADATDPEQRAHAVEEAASAGDGSLSGLAYCVGSIDLKPLRQTRDADFAQAFALNALAAAGLVREAAKPLKAGRGSVLLFSTVAVGQGFANHAVISAAKGAVEGLTRALAAELAPHIRVNAVAPSLTRTPLAQPMTDNETMAKAIAGMHAIPRLGEAEDIAAAAAFLLTEGAGWITGQILPVDGGRSAVRTKG